jgi:hypothetical protein
MMPITNLILPNNFANFNLDAMGPPLMPPPPPPPQNMGNPNMGNPNMGNPNMGMGPNMGMSMN